jgi:hypothetical protein
MGYRASIPLDAISDRGTAVGKLEATLKAVSCLLFRLHWH